MPETKLVFSEVTFGFAKCKPLFDNLSCSFANDSGVGKIIALMGPSGVGKTSFCDLALSTHHPQKGSIEFVPGDANIAVIPQKGVVFDELGVRDNITCLQYSRSLGKSFHEDKVQQAVESLGLSRIIESGTRASALSGGEAQRVMLARIQTIDCDVLILDEPCSFLDNRVKDSFLGALRATVNKSRLLAFMVTHVWDEAAQVADEVLFFHQPLGKAVTLHRNGIAEAQSSPPTVDALFGIHWPNCRILDTTDNPRLPSFVTEEIPRACRVVGLFQNFHRNLGQRRWAVDMRKPVDSSDQSFKTQQFTATPDPSLCWAFYDGDGLLIKKGI